MYLLIIFIVLFFITCYVIITNSPVGGIVAQIISTLMFYGIIFLIISSIITAMVHKKNSTYEYKDLYIKSAFTESCNELNGSFILGCGKISGKFTTYYIVYGDFSQGLKRLLLSSSSYYVKESESEAPKIKNYWQRKKIQIYRNKWSIFDNKDEIIYKSWSNIPYRERVIIVPKNTVRKEFYL